MTVGIVGLGLIGGSFAKAFQRDGKLTVFGTDLSESHVKKALSHGEIQEKLTDSLLPRCDIVLTALYPEDTVRYIHDHAALFCADAVVMDCCGIKEPICAALKPIARKYGFTFIGADPFAGKNRSGYDAASATLFDRSSIILTPYEDTPADKLELLCRLMMRAGFSSLMKMSAEKHDRIIALTSQLTHIISNALVKSPAASWEDSFFSGSFRDLTKRADLNEQMWSEVIRNNVITVTASRSYDVIVEPDILNRMGAYIRRIGSPETAVIVSDDSVYALYGQTVTDALKQQGIQVLSYVFAHGEQAKSQQNLFDLLEFMAEHAVTRTDLLVALGGGVTGDLTGFAASIYLRGTPFVQIPTSLLAAVDSSVGGKTAVNLLAGKNLAGSFNQPRLVLCDTRTLDTLPAKEFASGMAEVIKYGILSDPELFSLVETQDAAKHLERIICRCVTIKRELVMADEFDTGSRQLLNLGHTLAHAVEKLSHFSISHGHAVAIGLAAISRCAYRAGLAEEDIYERVCAVLTKYRLPISCDFPVKDLCQMILKDKKRSGQTIHLVIPRRIGDTFLYKMDVDQLEDFFSYS